MGFATYEELMAAVEQRRKEILTLEIDLGTKYSPEHEAARAELAQAKTVRTITGGGFLGDNIGDLERRVNETRPTSVGVWVQYQKLDLNEWASLMKQAGVNPIDQYERVLPKTFLGVYGEDPAPEEPPEGWVKPEPLTTDPLAVSSKGGAKSILPGGALSSVIQNFMAWQNSGGEVTIRPTRSGQD